MSSPARSLTIRPRVTLTIIAPPKPLVFFDPSIRAAAGSFHSIEDAEQGIRRYTTASRNGHEITSRIYGLHEARVLATRPDYFDAGGTH